MKSNFVLTAILLAYFSINLSGQVTWKNFFKPRAIPLTMTAPIKNWDFKPVIQVPAVKLTQSVRENAVLDAQFLASAGGGFMIQKVGFRKKNSGQFENYSKFSWSPIIFLLSGDTQDKNSVFDFSLCSTIGFFNNHFQIGGGYDFGSLEVDRSRWFVCFSYGVNLTQN